MGGARGAGLAWQTLQRDHAGARLLGIHRRAAAESGATQAEDEKKEEKKDEKKEEEALEGLSSLFG